MHDALLLLLLLPPKHVVLLLSNCPSLQPAGNHGLRKRKAPAPAPAAAKKPKAEPSAKPAAAKPAADVAAAGGGGELMVLSSKLTLKAVFGDAKPGADAPQLLGERHCVAMMLADTVRAAAAARGIGGGADALRLRLGPACGLTFHLAARRSVQFSRAELLALAADGKASAAWNVFVVAALRAWQAHGKEGSQAERLRLLRQLLVAAS